MASITTSCWKKMLLLAIVIANLYAFVASQGSRCPAEDKEDWSYTGKDNGEMKWGDKYPDCNGKNQSPIDIVINNVIQDDNLLPVAANIGYIYSLQNATVENNGSTIKVTPGDDTKRTITISGVTYTLMELHFHWGCDGQSGSEHTVDGKPYSMEMHLVHQSKDGTLAVVGIFFEVGDSTNKEIEKITNTFEQVKYKGSSTQFDDLDLSDLVPYGSQQNFFRYMGSLTTPPCSEGVIWSVSNITGSIETSQLQKFCGLYSVTQEDFSKDENGNCTISPNNRSVQPLNDRTVSRPAEQ